MKDCIYDYKNNDIFDMWWEMLRKVPANRPNNYTVIKSQYDNDYYVPKRNKERLMKVFRFKRYVVGDVLLVKYKERCQTTCL
jgi:hypothetical protein